MTSGTIADIVDPAWRWHAGLGRRDSRPAHAFGLLVFQPGAKDHDLYRVAVRASFAATSWGSVGLALVAIRRLAQASGR